MKWLILIVYLITIQISLTMSLNQEGLFLIETKLSLSDPTNSLSNWNSRDPTPCNWTGIQCGAVSLSEEPVVQSVDLSNLSLYGPFPLFLCRLPFLSSLSLGFNFINYSLPHDIDQCTSLVYLNLEQNLLTGPLPNTLPRIHSLRFLILEGNSFFGDIPETFGTFLNLEVLNLVNNFLNGTIPRSIGDVSSLRELKLAYNPFTPSQLGRELGKLSNLEYLWMSHCNLIGIVPDELAGLKKLENFDISDNELTGEIPRAIFGMRSVVQIELFNNSFSGEIPKEGWVRIPRLLRFDASGNALTGTVPESLCKVPLGSLNLQDNLLTGSLPDGISKSFNLYELKLFNNSLNGSLPSQLGRNSPLQVFDVSMNQFSGELPSFLCQNGALEQLLLIYNNFSGAFPSNYGKCRSLSRVRLKGNGFSGEFPSEFWGLPMVSLLDISENLFSGNISSVISSASNLSVIDISRNKFSGSIPKEIGFLRELVEFLASDNEISGTIPSTITNLGKLGTLYMSSNRLSGKLPDEFQSLKQLNELNLANNSLSGEISAEIGSLLMLNYLDLSYNQFSGEIPLALQNLKLNTLNLSYNYLSGSIPSLYTNVVYKDSFLGNPGLCRDPQSICNKRSRCTNRKKIWILRSVLIASSFVLLLGSLIVFCKCWKPMKTRKHVYLMKWRSFHSLDFSQTEIVNCLTEDNFIGSGGSGKVYKVELNNGEVVAVKKLLNTKEKDESISDFDSERDAFETEVETLGRIRHKNIVRLWCCSNAGDCKLLVYEYMINGSLGDLLHGNKGVRLLDWPMRIRIALDSADGISYLHHDCVPAIVHRDIKPNNILLDEDFCARISDFGVAKMMNRGVESMSVIAGSCGYIAPEYAYSLRVTEKSDIYSFGVVILELLTGKRPNDPELGQKDLVTWVGNNLDQNGVDYVIDQNLEFSIYKEQICKVLDIGLLCVSALPTNRPSMRRVVKMLKEAGATAVSVKPVKVIG